MLNVSKITEQIADHFARNYELSKFKITRSEPVNDQAAVASNGWIGIYKTNVNYEPKSLSQNISGWKPTIGIDVIVQGQSMRYGETAEDDLEAKVEIIIEDVLRLKQEGTSYIENIEDINVQYGIVVSERKTYFFQQAIISFICETTYDPN